MASQSFLDAIYAHIANRTPAPEPAPLSFADALRAHIAKNPVEPTPSFADALRAHIAKNAPSAPPPSEWRGSEPLNELRGPPPSPVISAQATALTFSEALRAHIIASLM